MLDVLLVSDCEKSCHAITYLLAPRFCVRIAIGLKAAVGELGLQVPDAIVCKLELTPYRGDALLSLVAREHPGVRRILCAADPGSQFVRDSAHVTLSPDDGIEALLAALDQEATA